VVEARGLALAYGRQPVLRDVDLTIRAGEFWFLLGPNGSGKTTLLKALLGILRPRVGRLALHSRLAARERLGFVPQRCDLNPSLPTTLREFVSLGFVGSGRPRRERPEPLRFALERAGLGGLAERDYWSLSGGQRQRALVARALVRRPSLLVLDEPTEGMDAPSEEAFLRTLDALNRDEGVTLLVVTHDLALCPRHASHVALFADGRVHAGAAAEILRGDAVERVFGVRLEALAGAAEIADASHRRAERP